MELIRKSDYEIKIQKSEDFFTIANGYKDINVPEKDVIAKYKGSLR